jgi:glutamine synthetase
LLASDARRGEPARRAAAEAMLRAHPYPYVKVGVADVDGIIRGKYLAKDKALAALDATLSFCDVIVGWDSNDKLYDNVSYTGWHTGYPDLQVRLLPETARALPWEDDLPFVLGEFAGRAEAVCPRAVLRRVVARGAELGYRCRAGFEYEFSLFEETPHSLREKRFHQLRPITPGNFGYSVLRNSVWSDFHRELLDACVRMDLQIEGLHSETGPGVIEAALKADDALEAADKAVLFKTVVKIVAQRRGLLATFMAKWSEELPGHGGHLHLSLRDADERPAFHDPAAEHTLSAVMGAALAGQQALLPEVLALVAPTINSYKRLVPGYWAPTTATWGLENRTAALRAITGSPGAQRIEYRIAGADANPYLVMAAALGSALHGVEHGLRPSAPVRGDAYSAPSGTPLARTLWDATQALRGSQRVRELLGNDFVEHFCATREWEEREYRRQVTDWELARYFEIV